MWDPKEINIKDHVTFNIIQPNYIVEIEEHILSRSKWKCVSITFETISKVLLGLSTVLSFASGVYTSTTISFAAGTVSTLSLVSLQFSNFSKRESKRSSEELNVLLKKLDVDTLPEYNIEVSSTQSMKRTDTNQI